MLEFAKKRTQFKENDRLNLIVSNPKFFYPISTRFECDNHIQKIKDKMLQILTSYESVNLFKYTFHIQTVNMPRGEGRAKIVNLTEDTRTKQCIVKINNKDDLCGWRAVIVGLTYHTNVINTRT